MREKQREMVAAQIAYSVEKALIAEVELSPKPGLVDAHSTGAIMIWICLCFFAQLSH